MDKEAEIEHIDRHGKNVEKSRRCFEDREKLRGGLDTIKERIAELGTKEARMVLHRVLGKDGSHQWDRACIVRREAMSCFQQEQQKNASKAE